MVSARGNSNLAFLRRNFKSCPSKLRDTAYCSLIRLSSAYPCSVWSPFKKMGPSWKKFNEEQQIL